MKNQKPKTMSIHIYKIYNKGSFEKTTFFLPLNFLRNVSDHLRNFHRQTLMYLGQ